MSRGTIVSRRQARRGAGERRNGDTDGGACATAEGDGIEWLMNAATHLELSRNSVMTGSLYPTPTCSVHVGAAARGACPTANAINASIEQDVMPRLL